MCKTTKDAREWRRKMAIAALKLKEDDAWKY
jgi:hypothetical protein